MDEVVMARPIASALRALGNKPGNREIAGEMLAPLLLEQLQLVTHFLGRECRWQGRHALLVGLLNYVDEPVCTAAR